MCEKTAEEQEFYILEETDGKGRFKKVRGEMVDAAEGIEVFAHSTSEPGEAFQFWMLYDLVTGRKLCRPYPTKEEAVRVVSAEIKEAGIGVYERARDRCALKHPGRSPARLLEFEADDIEVIQEPREPEIKTCVPE